MSHSFNFQIEQPDEGQRLDEFLARRFGSLSRMRIANMIQAGACLVNGAAGRAGYRLLKGDSVRACFEDGAPTSMSPEAIPLEVVYDDEHLIVVVKPAGMLVHPTMNVKTGTLANALAYHLNKSRIDDGGWTILDLASGQAESSGSRSAIPDVTRPGIVHRLDRATSGLIVIAKTSRALTVLSRHFRKRLVEKRYLALVRGAVEEETGSINAPIGRDPDRTPRWRVMEEGKVAETRFSVLERLSRATLLELQPVTGRTNQLRVHCAHIGHPIVGDEMHGHRDARIANDESSADAQCEARKSTTRDSQSEARLCLHASRLAFHHPVGGEWLEFTSPMPPDAVSIVDQFRQQPV